MTSHLGGHFGTTAMLLPTFDFILKNFNIKSVIDIGCGPGGMTEYINYKNVYCIGIDGDESIEKKDYIIFHDYIYGPLKLDETFDLAYSTEFLEHVEEKYIPNFIETFKKANYVFCTAAPPGQGGYHHVNEQPLEYWIKIFQENGFVYQKEHSDEIKKTCGDKIVARNSLFFRNSHQYENNYNRKPFPIDYEPLKKKVNFHYDGLGKSIVGYDRW
jgi:SAM-dependent methyltransferase